MLGVLLLMGWILGLFDNPPPKGARKKPRKKGARKKPPGGPGGPGGGGPGGPGGGQPPKAHGHPEPLTAPVDPTAPIPVVPPLGSQVEPRVVIRVTVTLWTAIMSSVAKSINTESSAARGMWEAYCNIYCGAPITYEGITYDVKTTGYTSEEPTFISTGGAPHISTLDQFMDKYSAGFRADFLAWFAHAWR